NGGNDGHVDIGQGPQERQDGPLDSAAASLDFGQIIPRRQVALRSGQGDGAAGLVGLGGGQGRLQLAVQGGVRGRASCGTIDAQYQAGALVFGFYHAQTTLKPSSSPWNACRYSCLSRSTI